MTDSGWTGQQAHREGWYVGTYSASEARYKLDIRAFSGHFGSVVGKLSTFREADARALAFVQQRAAEGSAYHIEALMLAQLT